MDKTINQRVKQYRNAKGYNQSYVAELMGMKHSTYSQMERSGKISAQRLLKLSKILEVEVNVLLNGEPEEKPSTFPSVPTEKPNPLLMQEPAIDIKPKEEYFVVTKREENIIKILRDLPKDEKDKIISYMDEIYKNFKKRKTDS